MGGVGGQSQLKHLVENGEQGGSGGFRSKCDKSQGVSAEGGTWSDLCSTRITRLPVERKGQVGRGSQELLVGTACPYKGLTTPGAGHVSYFPLLQF